MTWREFLEQTPQNSIALDGVVRGGPNFDQPTHHINFDHHDNVVREATMSTCKQVYFAIKGGLFQLFRNETEKYARVYVNDSDQDTSLAVWQLENSQLLEGTQSIPALNRLISLTDELDITGGAFPRNLDERLSRQQNWIFEPYTQLRTSGALANATAEVMRDNLVSVLSRINKFMMGMAEERKGDTRHEILYDSPEGYKIIDEIGGNEARYFLFSKGLNAFISKVATRADGNKVWTIGRRSRYIPFPVRELYSVLNQAEGLSDQDGWNGSDIIGGSSRKYGSKLDSKQIAEVVDNYIRTTR
jgi:hypothetical protein